MTAPGACDLVGLFAESGQRAYGESVTQLAHALQCADLARRDRADDEVVVAALLHDVGHFVEHGAEEPGRHHGSDGAALVRAFVPSRVAWLIEHHVVAKRYLCTVDARYVDELSPASQRSYLRQGARLEPDEQLALETVPWFADALRVRRWDDAAKVPGMGCPPLIDYASLLERYFGLQLWPSAAGIDR
jgi:predicted HD phosphohydrolase